MGGKSWCSSAKISDKGVPVFIFSAALCRAFLYKTLPQVSAVMSVASTIGIVLFSKEDKVKENLASLSYFITGPIIVA